MLDKPIANPSIVFREEFDDWALLFDPDTGAAFGLNPVSVFIWKRLDGKHTVADLFAELRVSCNSVPENADEDIAAFVNDLVERGFAGSEL